MLFNLVLRFIDMKYLFLSIIVLLVSCQNDEPFLFKDLCPDCTSSIEINLANWPSKPTYAWIDIEESIDTFFNLDISEIEPIHDAYRDGLVFFKIPYKRGEYQMDEEIKMEWGTYVGFFVLQEGYDTVTEFYEPVYDGSSYINVDSINKSTGEFSLSFDLVLFPNGDPHAELHNSSYPVKIHVQGQAQGTLTYE